MNFPMKKSAKVWMILMTYKFRNHPSIVNIKEQSHPLMSHPYINVTPIHKKDDLTDETNFQPVSVLPLLSKVFEQVIYNELGKYIVTFLNKLLC